jgi:hypothetical protein
MRIIGTEGVREDGKNLNVFFFCFFFVFFFCFSILKQFNKGAYINKSDQGIEIVKNVSRIMGISSGVTDVLGDEKGGRKNVEKFWKKF